jgi:RNA polymerase nonessential primary-like sigma factor
LYKLARLSEEHPIGSEDWNREDLALKVDITTKELDEALRYARTIVSLEAPIDENAEMVLGDTIPYEVLPSAEKLVVTERMVTDLRSLVNRLSRTEAWVLKMRFGLEQNDPMTLQEIGNQLALSRERIRQIESHSLSKLRKLVHRKVVSYID